METTTLESAPVTIPPDCLIVDYPYVLSGKRPKRFFINNGNEIIAAYMRTARKWEYESMMNLYANASRGGSFLEVGANIGTDTVLASDFFKNCYAFEPVALHVDLLHKNIELNQVTNIQVFPVAVGDAPGRTKVFLGESHNSGSSSLAPNHPSMSRSEEVEVVTLDTALPETVRDVTFMHIDTEGHDIKVLQGAKKFIQRQLQKPVIRIEFQPRTLALHGSNIAELIGFLDEFRYRAMFNANNNIVPFSYGVLIELFYLWRASDGWIDLLLVP
jgi:FkbM family methyltransferase